jgi:hypothetical protein
MNRSSIKMCLIGAAILVASAAQIQAANAQAPAPVQGRSPMRIACGPEMQMLCAGLRGRDARLCLRAHHAQLSAGCTAFLNEAKAKGAAGAMGQPPAGGPPPPSDSNE